jgi:uncharacterized membrane protein
MQNIDLTLAVNYVPACTCILRLLAYLLCLTVLSHYGDPRTYVLLGVVLYLDKCSQGLHVFLDSNSILMTVFAANVYQHLRKISDDIHFTVILAYFAWGVWSCILLHDRGIVSDFVQANMPVPGYLVEVYATSLIVCYLLFHTAPSEPYGCLLGQALAFAILSIVWTYLVGLRKHDQPLHCRIVTRFLPILILPMWMSVIFGVACVGLLAWHFRTQQQACVGMLDTVAVVNSDAMQQKKQHPDSTSQLDNSTTTQGTDTTTANQELDDIQEMFRLAKQRKM